MNKPDTLNRTPFIEQIFNLIETISKHRGNTTFAIDGTWGCGKSFVLNMLEEKLKEVQSPETADNKYFVINYNCWANDFYEEPLIAFVSAIMDNMQYLIKDENKRMNLLNLLRNFVIGLGNVGNAVVKTVFGIDPKSIIQPAVAATKAIKENTKKQIQEAHDYDDYFPFKTKLSELHTILKKLADEQTLVIIIDELDRCLPEYAIKVLERMHHITEDLPNTITIIATDKSKLKNTIDKIYGFKEDAANIYLKKFINFEVKLYNGVNDENVLVKYKTFIDKFDHAESGDSKLSEYISLLFHNISPREQEHLWEQAELVHNLIANARYDRSVLATELLLVVYANYYGYTILNGIKTTDLIIPFGFQNIDKNLSKFVKKFKQGPYIKKSISSNTSFLCVTNQTGMLGKILWYLNNFKISPDSPASYIQLDTELERNKKYFSNLEFIREFAETLKLIK